MRKIVGKKDRKGFYKLSLYILIAYIAMFVISLTVAIINYEISKYVNDGGILKWTALTLSTIHSVLIVFNWFAIRIQKGRIDYVKSSLFTKIITIIMDVLSSMALICNTVTSLINGAVVTTDITWLLPTVSFISAGISLFNFGFAIYIVLIAKKSVKLNKTI